MKKGDAASIYNVGDYYVVGDMVKGDIVYIYDDFYVCTGFSWLFAELTQLDKDFNPIDGQSVTIPRNRFALMICRCQDEICSFYEWNSLKCNFVGTWFALYVLVLSFKSSVILAFVAFIMCIYCGVSFIRELMELWGEEEEEPEE